MNLGNVIASSYKADKKSPFVTQEDHELLEAFRVQSFEVQVKACRPGYMFRNIEIR